MANKTKYNKEMLTKCEEYLDTYEQIGDVIPSHIGMFLFINLPKSTAYDWADSKHPSYQSEFSEILSRCKDMQHQALINKGLDNTHNAAITALVLGKHGYHKKVDQDVTSGGKELRNNFTITPVTTKKDTDSE